MPVHFNEDITTAIKLIDTNTGEEIGIVDSATCVMSVDECDVYNYIKPDDSGFTVDFNINMTGKRLLSSIIHPSLGNNNWRKLHGLPMWRR